MALETRLRQEIVQKLKLSPQMYQSIHVLELTLPELRELLQHEFQENPLIEVEEKTKKEEPPEEKEKNPEENISEYLSDGNESNREERQKKRDYRESLITRPPNLIEELLHQLRLNDISEEQYSIGETIIGNINEDGYLTISVDEIAQSLNKDKLAIEMVLSMVQDLLPAGVGARDVKECLLIQLRKKNKGDSIAYRVIENHLTELETQKYDKICRDLNIHMDELKAVLKEISALDPKPGKVIDGENPVYVMPDLILEQDENGNFTANLSNDYLPDIRINKYYSHLLKDTHTPDDAKKYIQEKMTSAEWIIKVIKQRQETITKIAQYIVDVQKDFFEEGKGHLKPLSLSQVAEKIGVDKSTVSRTVNGKYIDTHMGIFELKSLFSTTVHKDEGESISADVLNLKISELIKSEDRHNPLTDQDIYDKLRAEGINIARRTVTKYREELNILSSHLRKEKL
ncbi:MAG: RNA polymerase factor sigma-54 [Candidatus Omnitrophica bacterium]|nr:RNA polymerase factor sigma-54 [Candidatus Omnitrophota bacterium]